MKKYRQNDTANKNKYTIAYSDGELFYYEKIKSDQSLHINRIIPKNLYICSDSFHQKLQKDTIHIDYLKDKE